jgi:murein DD-endopeptidase MepM/ murein hydrolase activator NlpD
VSEEVRAPEEPSPPSQIEGAQARSETPESPIPVEVSGRAHALFWLAIGCAAIGVIQVPIFFLAHRAPAAPPAVATASASASARPSPVMSAAPSSSGIASVEPEHGPPPFRIAQLESDAIEVVHARVGKRTCVQALEALGVVAVDLPKIATAISPIRKLDGCAANDRIFVAVGKTDRRLHGVELETAPGTIVRVTEAATGELTAESVTLPVSHKRYSTAFVVVTDLPTAIAGAGLDASLIEPLDEAIGSRHDVPAPTRGSTFRVIADATLVAGRFDRFDDLVALEYQPRADLAPLRLYHVAKNANAKDTQGKGWFDAKGHQPVRAHWRMPLAFPRITSRFNPRRRHPILKVVMPHNGCDFAAPSGTPVYSIGAGIVTFRGDAGPSGNLITMQHEGSIESGYAHLSRFAPGVVPGTHVEPRTLIGYVGTTGRSTGPHLHLSVKRHGVFADPLSLKMDGFRVVPPSERGGFAARKLEADALLDAIAIPKVDLPAVAAPAASIETPGEDDELPH